MGDLGNFENLVHGVVPIIHRGRSYHSCGQQSKMGWDKRSSFGKKQKKKKGQLYAQGYPTVHVVRFWVLKTAGM